MWEGLQAVRKEIQESVNTIHDNEEIHDGFQLRFVGKSYAKFVTGLPSETVLVPDNDWNNQENNKDSQNIFITGDNLDALKHLVNAYSGAIKMIYIDPPYNTGSDGFVYKDSFKFSDEDLKQKLHRLFHNLRQKQKELILLSHPFLLLLIFCLLQQLLIISSLLPLHLPK